MNSLRRIIPFLAIVAVVAGCVSPPAGWSSKEAIERLATERVPIGSTKQVAEAFFRDAGVKWHEFPNASVPKAEKSLVGWADIRRSWPVTTSVGVSFNLGPDDKVKSVKVIESHTGP